MKRKLFDKRISESEEICSTFYIPTWIMLLAKFDYSYKHFEWIFRPIYLENNLILKEIKSFWNILRTCKYVNKLLDKHLKINLWKNGFWSYARCYISNKKLCMQNCWMIRKTICCWMKNNLCALLWLSNKFYLHQFFCVYILE